MVKKKKSGDYHHGDLRRSVLACAWTMLGKRGVDGLSLRAVAEVLGVSHAAPAHHFGDKAALLAALQVEAWNRLLEALDAAAAGPEALKRVGLAYIDFALRYPRHVQLMFRTGPGAREQALRAWSTIEHAVAAELGIDARTDPATLSTLAMTCWAQVHGLAALYTEIRLPPTVLADDGGAKLREQVVDTFLKGLQAARR